MVTPKKIETEPLRAYFESGPLSIPEPTGALPGSHAKIAILRQRVLDREWLHHPDDIGSNVLSQKNRIEVNRLLEKAIELQEELIEIRDKIKRLFPQIDDGVFHRIVVERVEFEMRLDEMEEDDDEYPE